IMLGTRRRDQARRAAEEFGCGDYLDALPDEVPYGVRKVAEVARAAAANPAVLLLDEPAAGLSREERSELSNALRRFHDHHPDTAVVLVEHDVRFVAQLCPTLAVLNVGRLVVTGETSTVLADVRVREAYLGNR